MKAPRLSTGNPHIELVEPDVERDSQLGLVWLEGELGRSTLSLMGVPDDNNKPTSTQQERERVKEFIENEDQLNWMIQLNDEVVGSVWANLKVTGSLPAPAIHIMIGNPIARGQGVGTTSVEAVINYLHENGAESVYSRSLTTNQVAAKLLADQKFQPYGKAYLDADGLKWQNVRLELPNNR